MKRMQYSESLPHQWKNGDKNKTIDQQLLQVVKQKEWMSPSEIYEEYSHRNRDAVTQQTVSKYLNELVRIGELDAKGRANQRKYRQADKPIQETREDYSSPLSEGLPDFIERRIQREVEGRVQEFEEELKEKLEDEIQDLENRVDNRINRAADQSVDVTGWEKNMDNHTETVLAVLEDAGEAMYMKDLMKEYEGRVEDSRSKRTVRRKLAGLQDRGKVERTGKKNGTRYQAV